MIKFCRVCGLKFETVGRYALCCSRKCVTEFRNNYENYAVLCQVCKKPLTYVSARSGHRFCSYDCMRNDTELKEIRSNHLKKQWENEDFRKSVISRMRDNNPSKNRDNVEKGKRTRDINGTLHIFSGVRGGNGKVSEAESMLMDFCADHNFVYNKAIKTADIRKLYPEMHYAVNYKPDFVNIDLKLCVEVDGESHKSKNGIEKDIKKEKCLLMLGYRIIRFWNSDVLNNIEYVKESILKEMEVIENGKASIQEKNSIQ